MEETQYWYEFQFLVQVFFPFHLGTTLLYGKYFANFTYENIVKSYLILYGLGILTYLVVISIYYYVWVIIMELNPPMPWTYYVVGLFPIYVTFLASWYR